MIPRHAAAIQARITADLKPAGKSAKGALCRTEQSPLARQAPLGNPACKSRHLSFGAQNQKPIFAHKKGLRFSVIPSACRKSQIINFYTLVDFEKVR
jgi:hypothetical protein